MTKGTEDTIKNSSKCAVLDMDETFLVGPTTREAKIMWEAAEGFEALHTIDQDGKPTSVFVPPEFSRFTGRGDEQISGTAEKFVSPDEPMADEIRQRHRALLERRDKLPPDVAQSQSPDAISFKNDLKYYNRLVKQFNQAFEADKQAAKEKYDRVYVHKDTFIATKKLILAEYDKFTRNEPHTKFAILTAGMYSIPFLASLFNKKYFEEDISLPVECFTEGEPPFFTIITGSLLEDRRDKKEALIFLAEKQLTGHQLTLFDNSQKHVDDANSLMLNRMSGVLITDFGTDTLTSTEFDPQPRYQFDFSKRSPNLLTELQKLVGCAAVVAAESDSFISQQSVTGLSTSDTSPPEAQKDKLTLALDEISQSINSKWDSENMPAAICEIAICLQHSALNDEQKARGIASICQTEMARKITSTCCGIPTLSRMFTAVPAEDKALSEFLLETGAMLNEHMQQQQCAL